MAPIAAEPPNASAMMVEVLMPTRRAASRFAAVASTALPRTVFSRNRYSATTTTAAPP